MDDKDQVVKHLEMIQGVVNRLAYNSFLIKGWSMTILAAAILFLARIGGLFRICYFNFYNPCGKFLGVRWLFFVAGKTV